MLLLDRLVLELRGFSFLKAVLFVTILRCATGTHIAMPVLCPTELNFRGEMALVCIIVTITTLLLYVASERDLRRLVEVVPGLIGKILLIIDLVILLLLFLIIILLLIMISTAADALSLAALLHFLLRCSLLIELRWCGLLRHGQVRDEGLSELHVRVCETLIEWMQRGEKDRGTGIIIVNSQLFFLFLDLIAVEFELIMIHRAILLDIELLVPIGNIVVICFVSFNHLSLFIEWLLWLLAATSRAYMGYRRLKLVTRDQGRGLPGHVNGRRCWTVEFLLSVRLEHVFTAHHRLIIHIYWSFYVSLAFFEHA